MQELGGRRGGYQSPEAVLADARRRADQIRRDAERDAARIRREAAAWAADARAEAEEHRDRIYADLVALADRFERELDPASEDDLGRVRERPAGEVIDLRAAAEARRTSVHETDDETDRHLADPVHEHPAGTGGREPSVGVRARPIDPADPVHEHSVIETNIETKVHDVVRLALRRTFEEVRRRASG